MYVYCPSVQPIHPSSASGLSTTPRGLSPLPPFPTVASPFPHLRRELGAIYGPTLLQRPPPSSEQAEPRALRTGLCPLAVGWGPFAEG